MEKTIRQIIADRFDTEPHTIRPLGGGFYGQVFLAEMKAFPYKIVLKLYLKDGLECREQRQLEILAKHSEIRMPKVYFSISKGGKYSHDVLAMEYLEGVNAGIQSIADERIADAIGEKVVDNLIAYHRTENEAGFGEIGGTTFAKDWRDLYRGRAEETFHKALAMKDAGKLEERDFQVMERAFRSFDKIFYLPITKACLIHGDYNMWNIMLNEDLTDVVGVIDPFNCCWADPEMDLYQLNNANGKQFGLMEKYRRKVKPSGNFELKNSFYELFTEVMHFHDANVDLSSSNIPYQAACLKEQMERNGI